MRIFRIGVLHGLLCYLFLLPVQKTRAEVVLPPVLSDGMVLQQGMKVPIWGTAADGEKVTVSFQGQRVSATAEKGKWRVDLAPMESGGPWPMTIQGAGNAIEFKEVFVGEVWLCGGQSNMAATPKWLKTFGEVSSNDQVRILKVHENGAASGWKRADQTNIMDFSMTGYQFACNIQSARKVPVGVIATAIGATFLDTWAPSQALKSLEGMKGKKLLHGAGSNYGKVVKPLQPFALKGVIWWQGEAEALPPPKSSDDFTEQYSRLFPALIKGWRDDWGQGDFPFIYVQLQCLGWQRPTNSVPEPADKVALIREAQNRALALPNVGAAAMFDIAEGHDLHPKASGCRKILADRMALAARAMAYGEKVVHMGPVFQKVQRNGDKMTLHFANAEDGLVAKDLKELKIKYPRNVDVVTAKEAGDGKIQDIALVTPDGSVRPVDAKVDGKTVVVQFDGDMPAGTTLYYAWRRYPAGNLYNKANLPALPFRVEVPLNHVGVDERNRQTPVLKGVIQ